jgi:hypothetical protein
MPELREKVLASDLQEGDERPGQVGATIGVTATVAAVLINITLCVGEGFAADTEETPNKSFHPTRAGRPLINPECGRG